MFKRLYENGGVVYVLGGIGTLAIFPAVVTLFIMYVAEKLGYPGLLPEVFVKGTLVVAFIGGLFATACFNNELMQVNEQRKTNERLDQLLEERSARKSRPRRRQTKQ